MTQVTVQQLEENIARMEKQLEEMKTALKDKMRGDGVALEKADKLWFLNPAGDALIIKCTPAVDVVNQGHYFTSKEAAMKESERRGLVQKMRIAAHEAGGVDWGETLFGSKYFPYWSRDFKDPKLENSVKYGMTGFERFSQLPHFPTEESLKGFIETLTKEQQKLLICGVD